MVYEERIYTIQPGKMAEYLRNYEELGLPVQREREDGNRRPGSNDPPSLQVDPDAVEDVEMLQDLVVAAINDAMTAKLISKSPL